MGIIELLFLAVGLSMDAFAVSVCKGLAMRKSNFRSCAVCGSWFGGFQALMPMIGYLLGSRFEKYIDSVAPWVAFVLLAFIGSNMVREALSNKEEEAEAGLDVKTMFIMAVATSIDALAVGVSFAFLKVNVWTSSLLIGITTFCFAFVGGLLGFKVGERFRTQAEIAGGAVLCLLGLKILLEGLGLL